MHDTEFSLPEKPASQTEFSEIDRIRETAAFERQVRLVLILSVYVFVVRLYINAKQDDLSLLLALVAVFSFFALLGVLIFGILPVYRLACVSDGRVLGVVCAILFLIPILRLLMLVILDVWAGTVLRRRGVRSGFLGANLDTVP